MAQTLRGYGLLTGNPFVDNGLAVIAALADCETIDQLTLAKIRRVHRRDNDSNGMALAMANDRLKATWLIFPDSMITNPSYSKDQDRLVNYAKLTTAILGNIGHEPIRQHCDICGNNRSVDLDLLFREALPNIENNKDGKKRYVCRDWFPLAGSMKNDAQALPAASRSLNCCAKCLYAVQYLPQAVFSVKGKLTVFSSTSMKLWYKLAKSITDRLRGRLDRETGKVPTIGTKGSGEGSFSAAITRMLEVMRELNRSDIGSVSMWMFSNIGMDPDVDKQRIPNAALEFVYEVSRHIPDIEINRLINRDTKNYQTSLLNCVINRIDYLSLYPSKKYSNEGASQKLFMLYQTIVMGQSDSSLRTAYNIARYVSAGLGDDDDARDRLSIDLDKIWEKQVKVRQLMVGMVADGLLSFDEYYELFVVGSGNGHPWRLVKYYLLSDIPSMDFAISSAAGADQRQPYKTMLIEVGKAIRDSYIVRKSAARFQREVLQGLGRGEIGKRWLWDQLQTLEEESANDGSSFDAQQTWRALAADDNLHELLFLLRLLWTGWQHGHI